MSVLQPSTPEILADQLLAASRSGQSVTISGNNSKLAAGGPIVPSDLQISTLNLNAILQHERHDLTISVGAGLPFSALQSFLQKHEQMVALDPPFAEACTVGGVVATDQNGPLRKRFGTVRDQVIGMTFAMLDGRLIKAGGMVVKNVAGLDLAKLMIGSFGTLGVITSVNLRVHPRPPAFRTFLFGFRDIEAALAKRDQILHSPLNPWSLELFSALAAARLNHRGPLLAVRAAGSPAVLGRYERELHGADQLSGPDESDFWRLSSNFSADFLGRNPAGVVLRLITPLSDLATLYQQGTGSYLSHAGSGVTDAFLTSWQSVLPLWTLAKQKNWSCVVAFAPAPIRKENELWLRSPASAAANGFAMMEKVKAMFDPGKLLNRSRLYGSI